LLELTMSKVSTKSAIRFVSTCDIAGALMTLSAILTWNIIDRVRAAHLGIQAIAAIKI